jgi:formimidoylglutamate deiminase
MHVEEQQAEITACVDHYHKPPLTLLNELVQVTSRFTAVHCTHSAAADLDPYLEAGGNICICPLTEANLGDGLANVSRMLNHNGCVCLGTDSNARISMIEEMRWLEYGQRLAQQRRGVCVDDVGDVAPRLLDIATLNGARALGLRAGAIRRGAWADFAVVDLDCPGLSDCSDDTLLASLIFGTGNEAIVGVCVGGRWIDF